MDMKKLVDSLREVADKAERAASEIERHMRDGEARSADPASVVLLPNMGGHGVVLSGRWAGWEVWQHPDGQWVTIRKLEPARLRKQELP